uniref:F5/8 type C domain-containing protein n=1 Tax=Tetradesmus obliquus TaxID=3088 RepID=A0A383VQX7_TETOB|eukprot:jgi/Sobl393_1/11814/SZX67303.1
MTGLSRVLAWCTVAALLVLPASAWDANAGLVPPLAVSTRTISVSTNDAAKQNIIDGNDQTQWQSGACFPTGFIARPEMNLLLRVCNSSTPSPCTYPAGSKTVDSAFDNSFYTGAWIAKAANGIASISVTLPQPTDIYRFYFRGSWNKGVARLVIQQQDGSTTTVVGNLNSTLAWVDIKQIGLWQGVTQVQVVSNDSFTLTELAAQYTRCFEMATLDMQDVFAVHVIRARWWSTDSVGTSLSVSADNATWTVVRDDLKPDNLPSYDFNFDPPVNMRFIRIRHLVNETGDWRKVYTWEIGAYGAGGRWGLPPQPQQQSRSFRQLMGVNGIWGWGNKSFSDTLVKQGKGPLLYNAVASSGRNYQNLNWDLKKLGNDPKWDTMNKTGTDGQWWLDWDREYGAWKKAGIPVSVTYQWDKFVAPPAAWGPDPYGTAYNLGFKFARHFGPTAGTGNVASFEAGNEPWDGFNATFYGQLLRGFTDGLYAGDPAVKRLPCALQANEPVYDGSYIGTRLPQDIAPKIDAVNTHVYSFFNLDNGTRVAVHPEHYGSAMNSLNNMIKWRDTNMPGKGLWVTEFGWDAVRPGEDCGKSTECVSQLAQAAYGVRALALFARKGVEQAHWFFYANDDGCSTLFCRSGLRDTYTAGFGEEPVYRAYRAFLQLAGASYFKAIAAETNDVYAYVLSSAAGTPTHVLAWRPIPVGESEQPSDAAAVQFDVGFSAAAAAAYALNGVAPSGSVAAALPSIAGSSWSMMLSGVPTLVVLSA